MSSKTIQHDSRSAARTIGTLFATVVLITQVSQAQVAPSAQSPSQARAISLDEAVRTAEAQSEAIRIARAGVQRAQGQQYQARSQRLPQLNGSASYTRTLASQFDVGGFFALKPRLPKDENGFWPSLDEWREWVFTKLGVYKRRTAEHPIPRAAATTRAEKLEKLA